MPNKLLIFTKHNSLLGSSGYYDAAIQNSNQFYRILEKSSGYYLYICGGLESNGMTPFGSIELVKASTLKSAKVFANKHYAKAVEERERLARAAEIKSNRIAAVRLPYKDN